MVDLGGLHCHLSRSSEHSSGSGGSSIRLASSEPRLRVCAGLLPLQTPSVGGMCQPELPAALQSECQLAAACPESHHHSSAPTQQYLSNMFVLCSILVFLNLNQFDNDFQ